MSFDYFLRYPLRNASYLSYILYICELCIDKKIISLKLYKNLIEMLFHKKFLIHINF